MVMLLLLSRLTIPARILQSCIHRSFQKIVWTLSPCKAWWCAWKPEEHKWLMRYRDIYYSDARNISSVATWEEEPAVSTLPRKLRSPASATLAMKFSSTRTLAVLKFLCTKRGLREWRWAKPAQNSMNELLKIRNTAHGFLHREGATK